MSEYINHPRVTVIVLTWNQRDLTLDCLASLVASDYPTDRLQITVVDNGSQDDTLSAIRAQFPDVTVVENHVNLGFAEGNNVGIRYALQGNTEYIMLLNNDTVVDDQMVSELIQIAQQDTRIGIVTPKIYYFDEPARIWCAGASIDWNRVTVSRLRAEQIDDGSNDAVHDVDAASGCAICLRREMIEQIGLIDTRFFFYYEETEWCIRATRAGWRIVYVPNAKLWHRVSSTIGSSSPATAYYMNRNVVLFLFKGRRGLKVILPLLRVIGRNLATIFAYTIKSHHGKRLRHRNVRVLALRDSLFGHWGKMGDDVARICYPDQTS